MPFTKDSGYIRTSVALRPDQYESLRLLALQASNRSGGKPDSGAILRGILDLYLAARAKTAHSKKGKK